MADGELVVDARSFTADVTYQAPAQDRVLLATVHRGTMIDTTGGHHDVHEPGDTFLLAPPGVPATGQAHNARCTITLFDASLLTEVTAHSPSSGRGPIRFTGRRPLDAGANRRLGTTIAFLRDHVLADPEATDGPVGKTAARHLAAVTLATLPNTTRNTPTTAAVNAAPATETLRRAMTFIEDNAHRDIGLADIATASHVTPRAVQYAFSRHADLTPLGYLRRVRLHHAHTALRASFPGTTTVKAIAARWGFTHQGRFAAAHRAVYRRIPLHHPAHPTLTAPTMAPGITATALTQKPPGGGGRQTREATPPLPQEWWTPQHRTPATPVYQRHAAPGTGISRAAPPVGVARRPGWEGSKNALQVGSPRPRSPAAPRAGGVGAGGGGGPR
ncbi:helix-turn-helix transcriptional regulator [Streptomyces zhihengii]|uniref:Helix-turn-helix domain-containing protein n=1 Tax=Streptomyces zhihengii TaxID=1818004 RepID=A0ABS2V4R6_9ACTN|nr:AraC family transcriptional regulator [Streptomyces zhihengii]MBM9624192.1 helix-turn-helix domain-containing protein [Streptomyces zhihengii]